MRLRRPFAMTLAFVGAACAGSRAAPVTLASLPRGSFVDDYGNRFTISGARFAQQPHGVFHFVEWHRDSLYVIARNDDSNPSDPGAFTRIDWMPLSMAPYTWAFCFTAWNAASRDAARATPAPDRSRPRTGCNGHPFSRMAPAP